MNVLVRLPNWLGDLVMSTAFLQELQRLNPGGRIDVIVRKELAGLVRFLPAIHRAYPFSKAEHPGLRGVIRFGRRIRLRTRYDAFFCLPDSFSSALMGFATGSGIRVGYGGEFRSWLLTHRYAKPRKMHRVQEYVHLLEHFYGHGLPSPTVRLEKPPVHANGIGGATAGVRRIALNFNSEVQSRRMPLAKAVSLTDHLRTTFGGELVFIGSPKESDFVDRIVGELADRSRITNLAGKTNLAELAGVLGSIDLMLSTDSGPAHLANGLGTKLIVLFGAGDEKNTGPYNQASAEIIRLPGLPCARCLANTCRYGTPACLTRLDEALIVRSVHALLDK